MPVHDWTKVDAGIFHDFHTAWIIQLRTALNEGVLPEGYYALAEQHAGETIPDVLTLHAGKGARQERSLPPATGGILVAEAPPRVSRHQTVEPVAAHRRSIAIRLVSGHQLVALIEIVSPGNKGRLKHIESFAAKVVDALCAGVHLLVVDLFPPGTHDPYGIHGAIQQRLTDSDEPYDLRSSEPLTLAAYAAGAPVEVYLEHLAAGTLLPDMPLFLDRERYVNTPLELTYEDAYRGFPALWREVLEKG